MTETLNNPFQELNSFKMPSFSEIRQNVANRLTEKKYVEVPTPSREQVLQNEIDKQMKIERELLFQNRSLSPGDIDTRIAQREEQVRGRLMRDDKRFHGMVTEPGVASGYRPVNSPAVVGDVAPDLNERLSQYKDKQTKVENPRDVFKYNAKAADNFQERVRKAGPTVEELTRLSPSESAQLKFESQIEEAREWLRQYIHNNNTGLDAAAENYIKKRYRNGEEIWTKLFTESSSSSS